MKVIDPVTVPDLPIKAKAARARLFDINDAHVRLGELALEAREQTQRHFFKLPNKLVPHHRSGRNGANRPGTNGSGNSVETFFAFTTQYGLGADILKLTSILKRAAFSDVTRMLLATPGVYESILLKHFLAVLGETEESPEVPDPADTSATKGPGKGDSSKQDASAKAGTAPAEAHTGPSHGRDPIDVRILAGDVSNVRNAAKDTAGLREVVLLELETPKEFFLRSAITLFLKERRIDLPDTSDGFEDLLATVSAAELPLSGSRLEEYLESTLETVSDEGTLRRFVERFSARGEIEARNFTSSVRNAMVQYLRTLGLDTARSGFSAAFDNGRYDEYFAQAYHQAIHSVGGGHAASLSALSVTPLDSDFDLDVFDHRDEQGVVRENILAASALAYFHVLGDLLGILPIANALILRRARGRLDLARGPGAQRLQQLKEFLRRAPVTTEDRQLLYRRVFNAGEGEVLPDTVVNEEYPDLMHTLMEKVVEYIRRDEAADFDKQISRAPIDEAVRNLQYNLSYFANDIAEDTLVIKEHFNLASSILSDNEVIASVGVGRRGNLWGVLQRLVPEELGHNFSVNTVRTLGVETYRVLQYVANFDVTTPDEDFRKFVQSCESLIIAQASVGDLLGASGKSEDEESGDEWSDEAEEEFDEDEEESEDEEKF